MAKKLKVALPEVILPKPWRIEEGVEGQGSTSPAENLLIVPFGLDQHSAAVRAHELAHIRWSPRRPEQALKKYAKEGRPETLQAVEDARVNILAAAHRVDLSALYPKETLEKFREQFLAKAPPDRETLRHLARTYMVLRAVYHGIYNVRHVDDEDLYRVLVGIENALGPVSRQLAALYDRLYIGALKFATSTRIAKAIDLLFPDDENEEKLSRQVADLVSKANSRPGRYSEGAKWLPMRVVKFPLPRVSRGALKAQAVRPSDVGAFRYAHRVPPIGDGSVFGSRRKIIGGGGILIDDSGSMSIPPEDIVRLVEVAPFGKVAKYSSDLHVGTVAVLADRGKMADPKDIMHSFGGGNGIDGLALRWLVANSRPPYVWVSDTYVTGEGDRYNEKLLEECMAIVRKYRVKICETIDEAIAYLERLKR